MIKKFNKKHIFNMTLLAIVGILSIYLSFSRVSAIGTEDIYPSIDPVDNIIEVNPGDSYTNYFNVGNLGGKDLKYKIYAEPYTVTDDFGSSNFNTETKYTQIIDWVTFDKTEGEVSPGKHDKITYTINIPDDAPGGGQYAAFIVEGVDDSKDKNKEGVTFDTITRVAYKLYAKIDGEINECAKILDNKINAFMFEPPITASSLVEDCGNVHMGATYIMKVYPLFSDNEIYSNVENPDERIVLPESRRFNTVNWTKEQGAPSIGIYNVEQTVKIGKESSTVKKLVFIFPLWLVIIIILLIAAIIFKLILRSRTRKESRRSSVNTPDKSDKSDSSDKSN